MTDRWTKPIMGCIKLNTDASIIPGTGMGIGAVLRDSEGHIVTSLTRFYPEEMAIEVAEAIACREGVYLARNLGIQNLIAEMDSLIIFNKIREHSTDLSYVGNVVADILDVSSSFVCFEPSYVRRCGNSVAHLLARHAFSFSHSDPTIGNVPEHVIRAANVQNCDLSHREQCFILQVAKKKKAQLAVERPLVYRPVA
ncbi:hypothetical protein DH2020_043923 [Rehmannia glutinosa]|uniref:RNase H type-1 domain-containing protein n=1 Tax=Rehmannia glutinosa TaxID=99300 RepID=A0ABR0UI79_REHGL